VETRLQLDFLRESGCREVQGFYFSYPVAVEEVERLVAAGQAAQWSAGVVAGAPEAL
jgi:EAL domain-containing protein (putative c-di-GMP-specific phosphodiesterase class I)